MLLIDAESKVVSANDAIGPLLGYAQEEIVGASVTRLIPDATAPRHLDGLRADIESGRRALNWDGIPLEARHRDGRRVRIAFLLVELANDTPLFCGLLWPASTSRGGLSRIIAGSIDPVLRVNVEGSIIEGNDEAARLFASPPGSLGGKDLLRFMPFLRPRWEALVETLGESPSVRVHGLLNPDPSQLLPCETTIQCVDDEPTSYLVSIRDLTLLKRQEEDRQIRYQQLFQRMDDGVLIYAVEGELLDANVKAQELLALDWADLAFLSLPQLFAPESIDQVREEVEGLERDGDVVHFEATFLRGDLRFPAKVSCSRLEIGGRGLTQVLIRDLTDRRELESQLHRATHMEALGMVAGGLAGDFNGLLTTILGRADELESISSNPSVRKVSGEIRRAAEEAGKMTTQLLAFGRPQTVRPRPIDLAMAVREAVPMLRSLLGDGVRLDLDIRPAGTVSLDPGQLTQVLVNLVANARNATAGRGRVAVAASCSGGTIEPWGVIEVSDDGRGMSEEAAARIFDPLFAPRPQADSAVGLANVHGIVTRANGIIEVSSTPGRGTRFTVSFPTVPGIAGATVDAVRARPSDRRRVLIVEDDSAVRGLMVRALGNAGYDTQEAANGVEALKLLDTEASAPDLVVTDAVMPQLDGPELVQRLWLISDVPALIVSGYVPTPRVERILADPRATFLAKPFRINQLVEAAQRILKKSQARRDSGSESRGGGGEEEAAQD